MHADSTVIVDGATLSGEIVAAVAERGARVAVAPDGTARAAAAHRALLAAVSRERVYGWTTGVGANNRVPVERGNGHGLRLLRSHAGGAGEPVAAAVARGALVIRLNQLAAGGSGTDPAWLEALATVLNLGLAPEFPVLGAIGTGDLTGLAATALALIGERPWRGPDGPVTRALLPRAVADGEALAFLSSNAVTLAELRQLAGPASLCSAVLSRGAEEHAAFSPQAARAAAAMVPRLGTVLDCELVAAVRALRQRGAIPASAPLRALYDQCLIAFPADDEDRPLDEDIAVAARVIAELAAGRDG